MLFDYRKDIVQHTVPWSLNACLSISLLSALKSVAVSSYIIWEVYYSQLWFYMRSFMKCTVRLFCSTLPSVSLQKWKCSVDMKFMSSELLKSQAYSSHFIRLILWIQISNAESKIIVRLKLSKSMICLLFYILNICVHVMAGHVHASINIYN